MTLPLMIVYPPLTTQSLLIHNYQVSNNKVLNYFNSFQFIIQLGIHIFYFTIASFSSMAYQKYILLFQVSTSFWCFKWLYILGFMSVRDMHAVHVYSVCVGDVSCVQQVCISMCSVQVTNCQELYTDELVQAAIHVTNLRKIQ